MDAEMWARIRWKGDVDMMELSPVEKWRRERQEWLAQASPEERADYEAFMESMRNPGLSLSEQKARCEKLLYDIEHGLIDCKIGDPYVLSRMAEELESGAFDE